MARRSLNRPGWTHSRFDEPDDEPLGGLSNLVDIVLVFACGLMAALASRYGTLPQSLEAGGTREVVQGTEMPEMPRGVGEVGSGYRSVGTVYRDPSTGKLILVGDSAAGGE